MYKSTAVAALGLGLVCWVFFTFPVTRELQPPHRMALLKAPLYLCTPFSRRTPPISVVLPPPTRCLRPNRAAAAGRAEPSPSAGAPLSFPRSGRGQPSPRRRKAARRWRPGNNGESREEREPRLSFRRPRRYRRPAPLTAAWATPLRRGARAGSHPARRLAGPGTAPSMLPTAACPEPAPLTGDPRSPLKSPGQSLPVPRRAAEGTHGFNLSLSSLFLRAAHPQTLPPPGATACRRASGSARLARRQPRSPEPIPGSAVRASRPMAALSPSAGCPRPPAAAAAADTAAGPPRPPARPSPRRP